MESIKNLLEFLNENWSMILTIACLLYSLCVKIKNLVKMSKEEKEAAAWQGVQKIMLALVSSAEKEWGGSTGEIKRSEIIEKVYSQYPILKEVANQAAVERKIDELIDKALCQMRDVIDKKGEDL